MTSTMMNVEEIKTNGKSGGVKTKPRNVKRIQTSTATITITGANSDDSESDDDATGQLSQVKGQPQIEGHSQITSQKCDNDDSVETSIIVKYSDKHINGYTTETMPIINNLMKDGQRNSENNANKVIHSEEDKLLPERENKTNQTEATCNNIQDNNLLWEKLDQQQVNNVSNINDGQNAKGAPESIGDSDEWAPQSHWPARDEAITNAELGIAEDHFSMPDGHFGMSSTEELEMAIANCKQLILKAKEHTERRRSLVNKLVQLRIRLQEAKEGPVEEDPEIKQVVGHRFKARETSSSKHYCEKCTGAIWGVLHSWYKCLGCGFSCHETCLNSITRTCASVKVAENSHYIMCICPEKGLAAQNYRCAECRTPISYIRSKGGEPRQCDYTGQFYCERCHWNDVMVIPARLLHNWDLDVYKVCRASKQFLRLMLTRPVLRIQDLNPMLFSFVDELNEVRKLREELLLMKRYFLSCKAALDSKLLLQLQERQHFVDGSDMYSLQDLTDVAYDILLPELAKIHTSFAQHIKTDCQLCQAKGYICELCDSKEVLFPFDNIAIVCAQCSTVLHRHCYMRKNQRCPKCDRLYRRSVEQAGTSAAT